MENDKGINKLCDICGEIPTCLCFQCIMYLCDSCFKFIHSKNKNSGHEKEKIDYFAPIELKCPKHSKDRINLFCIDENGKQLILI
jgi:hypothetical protein